jgi:3',5'-nucleoside bisphosphate phosphatase
LPGWLPQASLGLEVWHPDHTEAERQWLLATATEMDLIPTGGSDDHGQLTGYSIASETAASDTVDRLLARADLDALPN